MRVIIILLSLIMVSCGVTDTAKNGSFQVNSKYIISNIDELSPSNKETFIKISDEISRYSQEEIFFRPENRSVKVKFGPLDSSFLGLTECTFYSDNKKTNCLITLSLNVNPDDSLSPIDRLQREKLLYGVIRHELGHSFGMGHNLEDTNSVMYPTLSLTHVEDQGVLLRFIEDLTNFRYNGTNSGLRTIFDDK